MDLSIREIFEGETKSKTDNHFVFRPTEYECKNGLMHVWFISCSEYFARKSGDDEELEELYNWSDWTHSYTNLFRKVEYDWAMTYLARDKVDPPAAEVSWKFDANDTDVKMSKLELKAPCALYEDGCVIWTISTDQRKFVLSGTSLQDFVTFELDGATTLTITAFLTGGRGSCQYQHAQLFRQETGYITSETQLEIKLFLEPVSTNQVQLKSETIKESDDVVTENSGEVKKCYIFTPNEKECDDKAMHIVYNAQTDRYSRSSPDTESSASWMEYTYCCRNILRKEDGTEENAYLTRGESNDFGKISWKFDLKDSGLRMKSLALVAPTTVSPSRCVLWVISSGKQCFMEEGNAIQELTTFDLQESTELSITAFVKGGKEEDTASNDSSSEKEEDDDVQDQIELFVKPFEIHLSLEEVPPVATGALEPKGEEGEDIGYTFKPTEEEIKNKFMHICYSCNQDAYMRKSSNDELLQSWEKYTFSKMNLSRYQNKLQEKWYLARDEAYQTGEVTWKVDMNETGLQMTHMEIRANTQAFADGAVIWTIHCDEGTVHEYNSLQDFKNIELRGSSTLTITARTTGALGHNLWESTQRIFPQHYDDKDGFPFEIKIFLGNPRHLNGNIDASEWRVLRGSFGIPAEICRKEDTFFVFKPTKEEIESKMMHISYNCSSDSYSRGSSDENQPSSWSEGTYSCMNVLRKDNDDGMAYLARIGGTQYAEVTWKFDVSETNLEIDKLELEAASTLCEDARILWTIQAGEETFLKTAEYVNLSFPVEKIFQIYNAQTVSITAFLTGGKGLAAWKHAQLFRQKLDDQDNRPLQVKLFLRPKDPEALTESCGWIKGDLGLPANIYKKTKEKYIYKPTKDEIKKGLLHICYDTSKDQYTRTSSSDETVTSWLEHCYSSENMTYNKEDGSLRRIVGTQTANIVWKFDVKGTGSCMAKLELRIASILTENGCIIFTIESDEQKYVQTGPSLDEVNTFDLNGSSKLSITALLVGGSGKDASDPASLAIHTFDVKLFLKSKSDWVPWFPARNLAITNVEASDRNKYFTFIPTEQEKSDGKIHIQYDTCKDKYLRLTEEGCEEISGWNELANTSNNLMLVKSRQDKPCFLARKKGAGFADVSWEFDVRGTDYVIISVEFHALMQSAVDGGCITWRISTEKLCASVSSASILDDELTSFARLDLEGSKTLTVTAFLRGDTGPKSWRKTRLFEMVNDENQNIPFDIVVNIFEPPW